VKWIRFLLAAVTIVAFAMLAYRIYLAFAASRLASSGAGEEALFLLMLDPLWKGEFLIARSLGDPGSPAALNTLGISAWAVITSVTGWVTIRGSRSTPR
jgi:hypothetical protein